MYNCIIKSICIFAKKVIMIDFTDRQSFSIDLLRFPLCVLVVLCHTKIILGVPEIGIPAGTFQQGLQIFLCEVIPHIAVPTFIFFAGYLFFYKCCFNMSVWKRKFIRRFKGLLLPYMIWCTLGFIIAAITEQCSFTVNNFLYSFWDTREWMDLPSHIGAAMPADMPLWFIRDLIMMIIISPVIYWIINQTGALLPIITGIWWFSHWLPKITGFSSDIVFFFVLGAYLAIKKMNFVETTYKYRNFIYLLTVVFMIIDFVILNNRFTELGRLEYCWPIFNVFVLFGMFAVIHVASTLSLRVNRQKLLFWSGCSFFVYAVHFLYSPYLMKGIGRFWQPQTDLGFAIFFWFLQFRRYCLL